MSKKVYRGAGVARWGAEDGRSPYVGPDGYWYQWDNTVKDFVNTGVKATGTDGKTGPIPYPSGSWDSNKSYTRTTASAPYVEFMNKYYLLIKNGSTTGGPAPDSNPEVWEEMSDFNAIYTRMLIAAFANIGGAIFTGNTSDVNPDIMGRIISQWGRKNSADSQSFEEYNGDNGSWQPNLLFNLLDGSGHLARRNLLWNAQGAITFKGGFASPFVHANLGYIIPNDAETPVNIYAFDRDITTGIGFDYYVPCSKDLNGLALKIHNIRNRRDNYPMDVHSELPNGIYEGGTSKSYITLAKGEAVEMICVADDVDFHSWDVIRRYQCRPYYYSG